MTKKILLIIKTPRILDTFKTFLEEFRYDVYPCDDPSTALQSAAAFLPDLILSEASMPGFSGIILADLFKGDPDFEYIPFLLITSPMDQIRNNENENVDDIVRLPLNQTIFYGIITQWLESDERPAPAPNPVIGEKPQEKPQEKSEKNSPGLQIRKGKITCTTVTRLIYELVCNNGSGILLVKQNRKKMKVLFTSGKIVNVSSNFIRSDSLGQLLVRMNRITQRESDVAFSRSGKKGVAYGKMLVRLGFISEKELYELLTQQKTMKFLRLFQDNWKDAHFEFITKEITGKSGEMNPVALSGLLKTGINKVADIDSLYRVFTANKKSAHSIKLSSDFKETIQFLQFDQKLIDQVQWLNDKSIDEIKNSYPEHFDIYVRLGFLLIAIKAAHFGKSVRIHSTVPKSSDQITKTERQIGKSA